MDTRTPFDVAASCLYQAQAAYFCAQSARRHARTLQGTERRECFAYARAQLLSARRNLAWCGESLRKAPRECPDCTDGRNPDDGARICLTCHGSHKVAA